MAQAFARMHGGAEISAESAGSRPSGIVNPKAIAAMREAGYDLSEHRSKSLDEIPAVRYAAVVTMGCGDACPQVDADLREDWNIPDPRHLEPEEFRKVRDRIEQEVRRLLEKLSG